MTAVAPAYAIDAARSLRPMVLLDKSSESKNHDARDRQLKQSAVSSPTPSPSVSPSPAPGSVLTDKATGKPYVALRGNSSCQVSAAGGDLEAQLKACAGIKPR